LKRTKGPEARRLWACTNAAINSFPVPVWPPISTVMSRGAMRDTASSIRRIGAESR